MLRASAAPSHELPEEEVWTHQPAEAEEEDKVDGLFFDGASGAWLCGGEGDAVVCQVRRLQAHGEADVMTMSSDLRACTVSIASKCGARETD
jgi:hypothetical protein